MRKYCTVEGKQKFIALSKVEGGDIALRPFVQSFVRPSLLTFDYGPYPDNYKSKSDNIWTKDTTQATIRTMITFDLIQPIIESGLILRLSPYTSCYK